MFARNAFQKIAAPAARRFSTQLGKAAAKKPAAPAGARKASAYAAPAQHPVTELMVGLGICGAVLGTYGTGCYILDTNMGLR